MKNIIIALIFINISTNILAQNNMELSIDKIIGYYNNIEPNDLPDGKSSRFLEFDFGNFLAQGNYTEKSPTYYIVYRDEQTEKITRISQYNKNIEGENFEYLISDYEGIRIILTYKFFNCNDSIRAIEHNCGKMISGFFVQDKTHNNVFFLGTLNSKESSPDIKLNDIYCIMQVDSQMQCQKKLRFFEGFLSYKTEYNFSENLLTEKVYSYFYSSVSEDEECNKYNNLKNLSLKRIGYLFFENYHCPVVLEATILPDIPKVNGVYLPIWSLNGYQYK